MELVIWVAVMYGIFTAVDMYYTRKINKALEEREKKEKRKDERIL